MLIDNSFQLNYAYERHVKHRIQLLFIKANVSFSIINNNISSLHTLVSHYVMTFLLWSYLINVPAIVMTNSGWNKKKCQRYELYGETQTVVAIITFWMTFFATNSWSVTWLWLFRSVIITMVMGDISTLIITVVYVSWFELRFSHECWWLKQWHLAGLFTGRKNHDYTCTDIKLRLSVRVSRWTQAFACHDAHSLSISNEHQATTDVFIVFFGEHPVMLMTFCSTATYIHCTTIHSADMFKFDFVLSSKHCFHYPFFC